MPNHCSEPTLIFFNFDWRLYIVGNSIKEISRLKKTELELNLMMVLDFNLKT